ncbi:unnamed protein product [Sphagnum tenellum]
MNQYSWQKYLKEKHDAFAVNPMKSESGFQLLDVLVKMARKGSNPILYNVGSMVNLGSQETARLSLSLPKGLKKFSTNLAAWNASEESPKIAARSVIDSIVCRACPDKASAPCDDGWLNFEAPQLAIGQPIQKGNEGCIEEQLKGTTASG